jgi:hypothetical protein
MLLGSIAQYLQQSTRLDVTLVRVSIGYVFMEIVTESKSCHVYKSVLLTI